ncbi:MAG: glycosyltransferase family 2 protein [Simkaniaceae bacterium]|nr:glycosyltransferase family 2 protein [Simkaniaceae bacterium]
MIKKSRWWMHLFVLATISTMVVFGTKYYKRSRRARKYKQSLNIAVKAKEIKEQKPFVIIVPSYNNAEFVEKNLSSILEQEYSNFRVIYIDDCSTDATYKKAAQVVRRYNAEGKVKLIRNKRNFGSMANMYNAVHSCKNEEIVAVVDGDDWLSYVHVLRDLNAYYQNDDVWMTSGNYLEYPEYVEGQNQPFDLKTLKSASVRRKSWQTSHLRTFYAGLFKRIRIEDFLYQGNFFPVSADVAAMLPMLEMAREHAYYIPDILYMYNTSNPICDAKMRYDRQQFFDNYIRKQSSYPKLEKHPSTMKKLNESDVSDVIVFSYNRPLQLYSFLESFHKYVKNFGEIFVIYRVDDRAFQKAYDSVIKCYPNVNYIRQDGPNPHKNFKPMVLDCLFNYEKAPSSYVTFAVDDIIVKDHIDFSEMILELEKKKAHAFFLRLGRNVEYCYMDDCRQKMPIFLPTNGKVLAWQYSSGTGDWDYPHTLDFTLYRKGDILGDLSEMIYTYPNTMEEEWTHRADHTRVGLCYERSKILNIPMNIVSEYERGNRQMRCFSAKELLDKFNEGLKIDINPLYQVANSSAHHECEPQFVPR